MLEFCLDQLDSGISDVLIFAAPADKFEKGRKIDQIRFLDGKVAFDVFEI